MQWHHLADQAVKRGKRTLVIHAVAANGLKSTRLNGLEIFHDFPI
jgi:hypothetical protein